MRASRSLRNALLSVIALVVLFGAAGVAYTLLAGGKGPVKPDSTAKADDSSTDAAPKPVQPAANAPVGVSLTALVSPVKAGSNTSASVQTLAGAVCSISVSYAGVPSTDSGLAPKKADDYGLAEWSWTVGPSVPEGNWPVKVSCVRNGKSGVALGSLKVTH